MSTITLAEAQARLRKLAAERPDYVYPRPEMGDGACVYFNDDGTPSCIVGHALEHELRAVGIDQDHGDNSAAIRFFTTPLPGLDREALHYLAEAQSAQDSGSPWGVAVEIADGLAEHGALW